jgi:16S rRNA G966 N2-methylase RsmD
VREALSESEAAELELEENVRRKDLSWSERCKAIADIHKKRARNAALDGKPWGLVQTGELLGIATSPVWYALKVAERLNAKDEEITKCTNLSEAVQLLVARKAKEAERLLVAKMAPVVPDKVKTPEDGDDSDEGVLVDPEPPKPASYVELVFGDALEWLEAQPDESIDHIYTDPPYAIDMDNVGQDNVGMNVDLVRHTHDVNENLILLHAFIEVAAKKLRSTGFLVMWCDQEIWHKLTNWASEAGLRYQRWPLVWIKGGSCQNGQAYKNFTKATEIALVCSKSQATLVHTATRNYIELDNDKTVYAPTNPFWKPFRLHSWVLFHIAAPGTRVVDPFAGSGSIVLAAKLAGLRAVGIEKDETHFVDMKRRFE